MVVNFCPLSILCPSKIKSFQLRFKVHAPEVDADTQGDMERYPSIPPTRVPNNCQPHTIIPELLHERVFATDRYPQKGRINSYSKPEYLLDIVDVLHGSRQFEVLKNSPFGPLLNLPLRKSSLSGKLVHNILCRSLHTQKVHEIWFVFGRRLYASHSGSLLSLPVFRAVPFPMPRLLKIARNYVELNMLTGTFFLAIKSLSLSKILSTG